MKGACPLKGIAILHGHPDQGSTSRLHSQLDLGGESYVKCVNFRRMLVGSWQGHMLREPRNDSLFSSLRSEDKLSLTSSIWERKLVSIDDSIA